MRIDIADPNPGRHPRREPDPDFKPGTWGLKSSGSQSDTTRISTCKLCPYGVYKGQRKVWGNGLDLPIGWSHEECAEQAVGADG